MNSKGQMDFELVDIVAIAMGFGAGIIALIVIKPVAADMKLFWKIGTFIASAIAGYVAAKLILNK